MNIRATVSWDPATKIEHSDLIDIILSLENDVTEQFSGQLTRHDTAFDYLKKISFYASNCEVAGLNDPVTIQPGKLIYDIPFIAGSRSAATRDMASRIQRKHYIVTRNETVRDEEYCKFFSKSDVWNISRCDYQKGDYVERLRQTAYDTESDPRIYAWTNVVSIESLRPLLQSDAKFNSFVEQQIKPLISEFWKNRAISNDANAIKRDLAAIADVAEKYKQDSGMERME